MHRTQIYLPDAQTERLDARARSEGISRSGLIRRAVEEYLARDELDAGAWGTRWRETLQRSAGIAPYLPNGADYVESLRAVDAERLRELER
jgi:metal-responsive CopG/Arc/MetJ family transcriptional regulator